jgi:P-type Ca2+ transporter type 2C
LRAADVGVALGGSGTEAAREVADIVLVDDDLRSMLIAIEEGRTTYGNVRKSVHYLLSTNFSEIWVMLASVALGLGRPLTPIQLLWINLITDIFPGLALTLEPAEDEVMRHRPRDPKQPIVSTDDYWRIGRESLLISGAAMASYGYGLARHGRGAPAAGSLAFLTLVLSQLAHAVSCRSDRASLFDRTRTRRRNRYLELAIGGSLAMQGIAAVVPALRRALGLTRLGLLDYVVAGLTAAAPLVINELSKMPRRDKRGEASGVPPGRIR